MSDLTEEKPAVANRLAAKKKREKISARERPGGIVSTEKLVQEEIALIQSDYMAYISERHVDYSAMIRHLASFKDFRVFIPIVCFRYFDLGVFKISLEQDPEKAFGLLMMSRIFNTARALINRSVDIPAEKKPPFGVAAMRDVTKWLNPRASTQGRVNSKFYLAEMPVSAKGFDFAKNCFARENVTTVSNFNALPVSSRYLLGLSDVVDYYLLYGKVLPMLHISSLKVGELANLNRLCLALEREDYETVAEHIRAYEQIPRNRFTRLQNKLRQIQPLVRDKVKHRDLPYFRAFLNGRYTVKSPSKVPECTPSVSNAEA